MRLNRDQIEKTLLILFLISLPFNRRHTFSAASNFDTSMVHLYISDLTLLLLLAFGGFTRNFSQWKGLRVVSGVSFLSFLSVVFISPRETFSYYWAIKTIEIAFLGVYFANLPREMIKKSFIWLFISGVLQASVGILQFITQSQLGLKWLGETSIAGNIDGVAKLNSSAGKVIRAYGTFPHPNPLAAFLVVACATTLYFLLIAKSVKWKVLLSTSLLILNIGVFAAFSRAAIATLALQTLVFFIYRYKKGSLELKTVFFTAMTCFVISSLIFLPYLKDRILNTFPTTYNRTFYNRIGLDITKKHPIWGVGIGGITDAMAEIIKPTYKYQVQPPHNYIIEVACETGVIGLIIVFYIFFKALAQTLRDKEGEFSVIIFCSLISIFILMFFDHYFYTAQQTQLLLWLLIGLAFNDKLRTHDTLLQR